MLRDFLEIVARRAKDRGLRVKAPGIMNGMGYDYEKPYYIVYRLAKLKLLEKRGSKVILTPLGEKFIEYVIEITDLIGPFSQTPPLDEGRLIGSVIYAFSCTNYSFSSGEELIQYMEKFIHELSRLKERSINAFKIAAITIPRYYFEKFDDPLTLLSKIEKMFG